MDIPSEYKRNLYFAVLALLTIVSAFFLVKVFSEVKNYKFIGGGVAAGSTISFDGQGEVFAVPDLATVSFTIREEAKALKDAQNKVTSKEAAALKYLKAQGIAEKDIKTENYNSYPKYEYQKSTVMSPDFYPIPGKQVIVGYEVSEYITVKVRDTEMAGDLLAGIGALGVSELNGPNFSIENEDDLKAEARRLAIDEAKKKAESLSRDLGVRLIRIVNFSENGNYPMPFYGRDVMNVKAESGASAAPSLPTGENKIISNVSITYEIR